MSLLSRKAQRKAARKLPSDASPEDIAAQTRREMHAYGKRNAVTEDETPRTDAQHALDVMDWSARVRRGGASSAGPYPR